MDTPWLLEPTHAEFEHVGLTCVIHRKDERGHWCGYVGIPKTHVLHGIDSNEKCAALGAALEARMQRPIGDAPSFAVTSALAFGGDLEPTPSIVLEVHGGITWANVCPAVGTTETIHTPEEGLWWYGFDCGHYRDLNPRLSDDLQFGGIWRDESYARRETRRLAEQLAALGAVAAEEVGA